jgi:hypothetical protein
MKGRAVDELRREYRRGVITSGEYSDTLAAMMSSRSERERYAVLLAARRSRGV